MCSSGAIRRRQELRSGKERKNPAEQFLHSQVIRLNVCVHWVCMCYCVLRARSSLNGNYSASMRSLSCYGAVTCLYVWKYVKYDVFVPDVNVCAGTIVEWLRTTITHWYSFLHVKRALQDTETRRLNARTPLITHKWSIKNIFPNHKSRYVTNLQLNQIYVRKSIYKQLAVTNYT